MVIKKGDKMQKIFLISFVVISFSSLFSTASKTFNIEQTQINSIKKINQTNWNTKCLYPNNYI